MTTPTQLPNNDPHRGSYRDATVHCEMLLDAIRTSAYQQAITSAVKPGHRVIDFGAGTGVLSIFAARAGAGQVDAIEREPVVRWAREIGKLNGLPQIRYHCADHESFTTDGPVDLIISEWMGHCLFYESMLQPLVDLRDRWLKPGGVMLPLRVAVHAALVTDDELYQEISFLQRAPYGINWGSLAVLPLRQSRLADLNEQQIGPDTCLLADLDMATITKTPDVLSGTLQVTTAQTCYGLLAWFDALLTEDLALGTGPSDGPTHWRQIYLSFPEPLDVTPDRPLHITIRPPQNVEETEQTWAWEVSDGQSTRAVDERDTFEESRLRTCPVSPPRT